MTGFALIVERRAGLEEDMFGSQVYHPGTKPDAADEIDILEEDDPGGTRFCDLQLVEKRAAAAGYEIVAHADKGPDAVTGLLTDAAINDQVDVLQGDGGITGHGYRGAVLYVELAAREDGDGQ